MPIRFLPLVTGEYYHVLNRGVASQPTFNSTRDYEKFVFAQTYYRHQNLPLRLSKLMQINYQDRQKLLFEITNSPKKVEIVAYCLMPNHFHLLLKQNIDGGLSNFIKRLIDSYTKYYNIRYQRAGPLFQGVFKAFHIQTNEQLLHISRYIHLNPLVSYVIKEHEFVSYKWSSLKAYMDGDFNSVNSEIVMGQFKNSDNYLKFIMDRAGYAKTLETIKHLILE